MDLVERIRHFREKKRIKQSELSEALGIDSSNYSRIEKRGKQMSVEQLEKIARVLDVSVAELLSDEALISNPSREKELEEQIKQKDELINVLLNRKEYIEEAVEFEVLSMLLDNAIERGLISTEGESTNPEAPLMNADEFIASKEIGQAYLEGLVGNQLIQRAVALGIVKSDSLKEAIESIKNLNIHLMKTLGVFPKSGNNS